MTNDKWIRIYKLSNRSINNVRSDKADSAEAACVCHRRHDCGPRFGEPRWTAEGGNGSAAFVFGAARNRLPFDSVSDYLAEDQNHRYFAANSEVGAARV